LAPLSAIATDFFVFFNLLKECLAWLPWFMSRVRMSIVMWVFK
jgi:hypothetical protein